MKVIISPAAEADLADARDYLAQTSPKAAHELLSRFGEVTQTIASGLIGGREVVLKDGRPAQRWPMPPYTIYYRKEGNGVEVLRVYHHARRPIERED